MKFANLIVTISVASVLPCFGANERVLEQLHSAEVEFMKAADERATIDWDGWRRLQALEKKLFVLMRGSQTYQATNVYKSDRLKNGFDLSSFVADDTIHVTEFDYVPIACRAGATMKVEMVWRADSLSRCDFYLGHPGQMHEDGYRSVVKLPFINGKVTLPAKMPKRDVILFAIVKAKGKDYYKFVFVVRPQ